MNKLYIFILLAISTMAFSNEIKIGSWELTENTIIDSKTDKIVDKYMMERKIIGFNPKTKNFIVRTRRLNSSNIILSEYIDEFTPYGKSYGDYRVTFCGKISLNESLGSVFIDGKEIKTCLKIFEKNHYVKFGGFGWGIIESQTTVSNVEEGYTHLLNIKLKNFNNP